MIELGRHIEILLLDYECVIVPGLGGFMTHHVEAHYDEADNMFLPPLRTLGFNPKLKINDSLLAQSYVEAYDISYPEAVNRIEEEVNELKQHIQNEGAYELNDIGTISLNDDGNYVFEPCEAGVLTPWLYGLCSFEMKKLPGNDAMATDASQDTPAPAESESKNEQPASTEETSTAAPADTEGNVIRIKVAWIRNAVTIAAAFIAFFVITPPISNSYQNSANFGSLPSTLLPTNILNQQQESASESVTTAKEPGLNIAPDTTKLGTEPLAKDKPASDSIETASKKANGRYCIVLASCITKKNAEAFVNELHAQGWNDADVYVYNDIVRVVYGHYEKEAEAYDTLRNIRNNKYFEEAWVYKRK